MTVDTFNFQNNLLHFETEILHIFFKSIPFELYCNNDR